MFNNNNDESADILEEIECKETININEFSNYCRGCLNLPNKSDLVDLNLIYDEDTNITYYDCFYILTNINLKNEFMLPRNLCKRCTIELQMSYDFQKKLKLSQKRIEEIAKTIVAEETSTPIEEVDETELIQVAEEHLDENLIDSEDENFLDSCDNATIKNEVDNYETEFLEYEYLENNNINQTVEESNVDINADDDDDDDEDDDDNTNSNSSEETIDIKDEIDMENDDDNLHNVETIETRAKTKEKHKVKRENSIIALEDYIEDQPKKRIKVPITGGPPYKCEHCDHLSATRALLASHRHRKHRHNNNKYICNKCGRKFANTQQMHKHMKRVTCESYPEFNCEYCGKKIIGRSNFDIHMRFHKKQYPFVCHICAKNFALAIHLTAHIKTKHENLRFVCEEADCGKMFQTRHSLKLHTYQHIKKMPYKCKYCQREHPSKGRLRFHIKRSHNIKHNLDDLESMRTSSDAISISNEMKQISSIIPDRKVARV